MEHLAGAVLALRVLQSPMQTAGMAGMVLPQASPERRSLTLVAEVALVMRLLAEVQTAQAERAVVVLAIKMPLALRVLQISGVAVGAGVVLVGLRFKMAATVAQA